VALATIADDMTTPREAAAGPSDITFATRAAPGVVNEDYVAAGPDWAVVLDGATAPAGVDSGCVHDVAWLVHRLAAALSAGLAGSTGESLGDVLAAAIKQVCAAHADTCDLANPDSPSSTVALARWGRGRLECLVLADSPIVVHLRDGSIAVVEDDRIMRLPGGPPYTLELVRAQRNRPGGFWVASTSQAAAYEAVTATFPEEEVDAVAMLTDGVTRLIDRYRRTWRDVMEELRTGGPDHVIDLVRAAELAEPAGRGKAHDDATALLVTRR
jgi:hypothetical protein